MGVHNKPLSQMSLAELRVNLARASEDVARYRAELLRRQPEPHTAYSGMYSRDCYCTATKGAGHNATSVFPWISKDEVEA